MNKNKVFRENAKAQLGGSIFSNTWLMALLACLIADLILSAASSFVVGTILVSGFLAYGLCHVFLQLVRGQKDKVELGDLFSGGNKFGELLVLSFMQGLFTFLWTLLFIIPGIIKSIAYSMAFYIKYDHPEYDWRQCLNESQRMMKGHKWQYFCLQLSFIGWILLGTLCCFVGVLWVVPYMSASAANFYENLKALYDPEEPGDDEFAYEPVAEAQPETEAQPE